MTILESLKLELANKEYLIEEVYKYRMIKSENMMRFKSV
jgi:hypothetical protein